MTINNNNYINQVIYKDKLGRSDIIDRKGEWEISEEIQQCNEIERYQFAIF